MARKPTVYVVHWPEIDVVKVGYSSVERWTRFVFSGADVIELYEFDSVPDAYHVESWLHDDARATLDYAFDGDDATPRILLGNNGAGRAECWNATRDQVAELLSRAMHRAYARTDAQA